MISGSENASSIVSSVNAGQLMDLRTDIGHGLGKIHAPQQLSLRAPQ